MRIRKRQPVVVVETPPSSSHLARPQSAISHERQEPFVAQNGCWHRDHQGEVINKESAKQDASPVRKFVDKSLFKRSQGAKEEAQSVDYVKAEIALPRKERTGSQTGRRTPDDTHKSEVKKDDTQPRPYGSVDFDEDEGRVCGNQDTVRFTNEHTEVPRGDRELSVERDHPSNKPRESLLYSLYSVFSRLSGKTVLTAREALSKIIEEGLPGLDEEIGLPSVQVAKVMRSNPYFVHLDGGKFLLCSGPSLQNKEELISGLDLANTAVDLTVSQPITVANGIGNRDRDGKQEDYTNLRHKRARSKNSSSTTEMRDKTEKNLRADESAKIYASKTQASALPKIAEAVQICKRYDGRGWKCHEKALEGYSMCRHHHELIVNRLARLRNSGRLGTKKSVKKRKSAGKQVSEGFGETEVALNIEQGVAELGKNLKARSLKSINT